MRRFIPPINCLIAFEAVAKHLSFSRAADELALTQSAVSRQIKLLEDQLNVQLFERLHHNLVLTDAGNKLLPQLIDSLELMSEATSALINFQEGRSVIRIGCTPTLASKILVPQLVLFQQKFPDITFELVTRSVPFNLLESDLDIAINMGNVAWPGTAADRLLTTSAAVVCSPAYRDRIDLTTLADVSRADLLHSTGLRGAWADWLHSAGVSHPSPTAGWHLEQFEYLAEAAAAGGGVAILPRLFIAKQLQRGELIELFAGKVVMNFTYLLIIQPSRRSSQAISIFRDWILKQRLD